MSSYGWITTRVSITSSSIPARSLTEVIDVLTSINATKFPLKFDVEKHTPDAVEQCLFTFESIQTVRVNVTKKVTLLMVSKDKEIRDLKNEVTHLKQQLKNVGKRLGKRPHNRTNTANGVNPKRPRAGPA